MREGSRVGDYILSTKNGCKWQFAIYEILETKPGIGPWNYHYYTTMAPSYSRTKRVVEIPLLSYYSFTIKPAKLSVVYLIEILVSYMYIWKINTLVSDKSKYDTSCIALGQEVLYLVHTGSQVFPIYIKFTCSLA